MTGREGQTSRRSPLPPTFPDLISLDLFATTLRLGSISAAASAHGMTQPSVSARIRSLERRLGLQLLDRSASGSRPTAQGAVVGEWVEALLQAADELTSAVTALRETSPSALRIAASYTIAEFLLPSWVTEWRSGYPEVGVELSVMNSTAVVEAVRAGAAAVGFIESPARTPGLRSSEVGTDELVVVVSPDHPWARRRTPLPARQLCRTPFVMRETGSGTREALAAALLEAGYSEPPVEAELSSTAAVRETVAAGLAPAALSRLAVAAEIANGRLVNVAVSGIDLTRKFRAVWSGSSAPQPPIRDLVGIARSNAQPDSDQLHPHARNPGLPSIEH